MPKFSVRTKLVLILMAAFAVRLAAIFIFRTYAHPVMWEYEDIANNLLSGKGFIYDFLDIPHRSFNNPLYSFVCAGIYIVTAHSYLAVLLLQSLFSIFLAVVIFKIAEMIFDENTALLAAFFASMHPGYVYYDVFNLIPLSIDAFFIAASTLLFLYFMKKPSALRIFLTGALIGMGALSRGIIGSLLPFFALYMLIFMKRINFKEKVKMIMVLGTATMIMIAPWIVRNYMVHKEFVFLISTTGENLWRGNNVHATGTSLDKNGKSIIDLWPDEFRRKVYAMKELELKKFFEKEAVDYIRDNPGIFLKMYLKKAGYFWWFSPQSGIIYPHMYLVLYRFGYLFVFAFTILGVAFSLLRGRDMTREGAWLLIFVLMSACITQSFFYVEGRHRWLVEPLMLIFCSYGVLKFFSIFNKKVLTPGGER